MCIRDSSGVVVDKLVVEGLVQIVGGKIVVDCILLNDNLRLLNVCLLGLLTDDKNNEHQNADEEHPHDKESDGPVSYTHLRAHETVLDLVCRLLLEKKKQLIHNDGKSTYCMC
eukprot:TRINITY_DN1748_c0_g1_i1.p1 TRINITY_DN1748_c0_g1~~TRINITY_DN1748_c0_g1_i1.p1  ORF type:complete len:113 (-),score=33.62 TRINITY_DN1748_c0_g1_i1:49-387(-)